MTSIDPLPAVIHCSRRGCSETIPSADLPGGWIMIASRWWCPAEVRDGRYHARDEIQTLTNLDGVTQDDADEIEDVEIGGES